MNRGEVRRLKGELDLSLKDLNKAVELEGKSATARSKRGDTYRYLGDYARALDDYGYAINAYPNFAYAYTGRGLTYEKMGDLARARAEFRTALAQEGFADSAVSAKEAAAAHIAALDSGSAVPEIQPVPQRLNTNSVPSPKLTIRDEPKPDATGVRRVALVIGNSAYATVGLLPNPEKDARIVAESLRNIGFQSVTVVNDTSRERLVNALRAFATEAESADWAMVYYAGHGMEVGGVNYLIPVDARLAVDRDIEFEAVPVTQVLSASGPARKLKLVVLDACRNNPFSPRETDAPARAISDSSSAGAAIASRGIGKGLAEVKVQNGTLVVFAAKDGHKALDGEGDHSPFAVALVQRIGTPGVEINKIFRLVRDDVMEATAGLQEPYTYGSLPGKEDFYFVAK